MEENTKQGKVNDLSEDKEIYTGKENDEYGLEEDVDIPPVYILSRVREEIMNFCMAQMPKEALGVVLGYKRIFNKRRFVKIVDWATGEVDSSHTHAKFTTDGVVEYNLFIQERYGDTEDRPVVVGIFHSHPFGREPFFSSIDKSTFLNFPYNAEYNVFILIDPIADYFKVYIIFKNKDSQKILKEVDWAEYFPKKFRAFYEES